MTRDERIEAACTAVFTSESAKADFRKTAALFPDFYVFWNPDDPCAMLERDGLSIEFYDLT